MGSGCSRDPNNASSVVNPSSDYHAAINAELAPFLSLDSPYNINYKFTHFFELIKSETVGTGIRRTVAYRSKLPLEDLKKQRTEFWETRVEGKLESWKALRAACEASEINAIPILAAAGIKLVNQTLQLSFDSEGNKYDVPAFCINDPLKYDVPQKKQLKKEDMSGKTIQIKLRAAGSVNDVNIDSLDTWTGLDLKQAYIKQVNDANLQPVHLRFFFGGKELKDKALIAEHNLKDEHVIQVFKKKVEGA